MTVNRDRNENSIQPINRTINPLHVRKKFSNHTDHRHFKSAGNGKIWQGSKDEEILAKFFLSGSHHSVLFLSITLDQAQNS